MDEITCPHCGYFADLDSFEAVSAMPLESESGKEYGKYECPNCGGSFCVEE